MNKNQEEINELNRRKPKNTAEKELLLRCYKEGLKNGWASGKYAKADGNFIVEEDRLNQNSICFIDELEDLKNFLDFGNWCLGQGIIYKNLFLLQQVNGGDEWATYKINETEIKQIDSISFQLILNESETEFNRDIAKLIKGYKSYWGHD